MTKKLIIHFITEQMHIASRHMFDVRMFDVIREIQTKPTMRCHYKPRRMPTRLFRKTDNTAKDVKHL